jgi:nucleotide-binding universal stress UspA family protein
MTTRIDQDQCGVAAGNPQCDSKCIATFDKHIYDSIAEEAKHWPADLIVIATHGRRGVRRLLLGSVAEGLARVASKPVLLVRSE